MADTAQASPASAPSPGVKPEMLRLMTKVARMYHERNLRQIEIARELHISQPRVSRLLKQAEQIGLVRTIVSVPLGVHTDIEERLEERFGLQEVLVVDEPESESGRVAALGAATAGYLETTLIGGDTVGISSWSNTLLAAVESLPAFSSNVVDWVVQLVGGLGQPTVQVKANSMLQGFSHRTGATPVFVNLPGVTGSASATAAMVTDSSFDEVVTAWRRLTVALVGIGSLEPSPLLRESGNILSDDDRRELQDRGAVGDICLRYFDARGELVKSSFNDRVVAIPPKMLRAAPRRVGAAGGERKLAAIKGAVEAGWINVLITDLPTARQLLAD